MKLQVFRTFLALFFILSGCSRDATDIKEELLRVNDYTISRDEVASRLKFETELNSNFYLSQDSRTEFVKDLIQSQLLIQEAKRQKFDQSEKFRQTIQRYWESTLIRDLLAEKGAQLRKATVVTKEEVENYYQANREFLPEAASEELQKELAKKIEDQKVSERLAAWIDELKAGAKIDINDPELAAKVNGKSNDG